MTTPAPKECCFENVEIEKELYVTTNRKYSKYSNRSPPETLQKDEL